MRRAGLLRQQLLDLPDIRGGKRHLARQTPGPPARLVLEQVVPVRPAAHHLAGSGQPEPLPGPAVGLHLRHGRRLRLLRACGATSPALRRTGFSGVCGALSSCTNPVRPAPRAECRSWCRARSAPGARLRDVRLARLGASRLGGLTFRRGRRRGPAHTRGPFGLQRPLARHAAFGLCLALPAVRPDNHDHVAAVLLGLGLDEAELLDVAREALQQPEPELGPGLLASPEHDRHLDLVSLPEEPLDVALLGPVVMRVDLGPKLDLLDDRLGLVLAGLPGLERGLVLELAVVHELGNRWPCRGRDLDQVEV